MERRQGQGLSEAQIQMRDYRIRTGVIDYMGHKSLDQQGATDRALQEIRETGQSAELDEFLQRLDALASIPLKRLKPQEKAEIKNVIRDLDLHIGIHSIELVYNAWRAAKDEREKPQLGPHLSDIKPME